MVPEGAAAIADAPVGATVAAGAVVAPAAGTAVGAVVACGAETGVAVADEPHARMAASRRAKGPRIIAFGCFNQWFKWDIPPIFNSVGSGKSMHCCRWITAPVQTISDISVTGPPWPATHRTIIILI